MGNPVMTRKHRLRRVVILCCSFARNLAYYRVGWMKEHQHLLDPAKGDSANFWRAVNGNFLDMCVLEWCKLFADRKGKQYWEKIVSSTVDFKADLLAHLGLDDGAFQKEIETMRKYRDEFVAHLDSAYSVCLPRFDIPKNAVWFYHAHIVRCEAESTDLAGLQTDLDTGYKQVEDEAKAVYQRARAL